MIEEVVRTAPARTAGPATGFAKPHRLTDVEGDVGARVALPMAEFARVLGGGIVPGSLVLVGGGAWNWKIHSSAATCA